MAISPFPETVPKKKVFRNPSEVLREAKNNHLDFFLYLFIYFVTSFCCLMFTLPASHLFSFNDCPLHKQQIETLQSSAAPSKVSLPF